MWIRSVYGSLTHLHYIWYAEDQNVPCKSIIPSGRSWIAIDDLYTAPLLVFYLIDKPEFCDYLP